MALSRRRGPNCRRLDFFRLAEPFRGRYHLSDLSQGAGVELLISFNFDDVHLAEALRASLFVVQPDRQIVLSPACYGAVFFEENIATGVHEADAFLLLIGPKGISRWQEIECGIARERNRRDGNFPVLAVLAGNSQLPQDLIPFGMNLIKLPVVTDRTMLRRLLLEL